jgi:hypothetical protein
MRQTPVTPMLEYDVGQQKGYSLTRVLHHGGSLVFLIYMKFYIYGKIFIGSS